jgi:hypothetical protein
MDTFMAHIWNQQWRSHNHSIKSYTREIERLRDWEWVSEWMYVCRYCLLSFCPFVLID